MNAEQIAKLKELAQKAEREVIRSHGWAGSVEMLDTLRTDEEYLTAASPAAILELIALAERTTSPVSQITDEQIDAVYCEMYEYDPGVVSAPECHLNFARRILAAAAPQAQAPAAPVAEQGELRKFHNFEVARMARLTRGVKVSGENLGVGDQFTMTSDVLAQFVNEAILQAAIGAERVPDGWRLVPVEPTDEMSTAGKRTLKGAAESFERQQAISVFKSMVRAAPAVQQPQAHTYARAAIAASRQSEVPHECRHSEGDSHVTTAWINGWNDCRSTMLGELTDDPTNHAAAAIQQPDVKAMVDRFLGWKLPENFYPDCHISFDRERAAQGPFSWPIGTNLLTADQAEAMFRYCLGEGAK